MDGHDNCQSWLCDNCFENNWNKNCNECKSKYEDIDFYH